jgi:hypothetical protein
MSKLRSFFTDVVGAAPSAAAKQSTRGSAPEPGTGASRDEKPDVDQMAVEVYREVMRMIEINRERNGDPDI